VNVSRASKQFALFPRRPKPPPITKVVTLLRGTEDETRIEIIVKGRGRRITSMRLLKRE